MLNSSFFVRNRGVKWKVLSDYPCHFEAWRERLSCFRCFEGVRCVSSPPSMSSSPPKVVCVSPLFGQGRAMHSAECRDVT